jgi:hypothetical protein
VRGDCLSVRQQEETEETMMKHFTWLIVIVMMIPGFAFAAQQESEA